jgi:formate C-acetyltransferase
METATAVEQLLQTGFGIHSTAEAAHRLPEVTRELAARTLAGEYGRQMRPAAFRLPPDQAAEASPVRRYAALIRTIAQRAPLRVVPLERLAGASTLLEATHHRTPGDPAIPSTSHTTLDFAKALRIGYAGLRAEIEGRLARGGLDDHGVDLLESMLVCIEAAGIWHERYVAELSRRAESSDGMERQRYRELLSVMERVPEQPPRTFYEAVQALWEVWEFQRLCGNWSGLGRLDWMLGPYLECDLAERRITLDGARDLLAHFWIKGAEWVGSDNPMVGTSGDAQFYQNVVLGGVDREGRDVLNPVTYLVLDVVQETHIGDYPVAVRVNARTPERLWRRIAEVQRTGGGIVTVYNEALVLRALTRFGYPLADAREFANDGCWEVLIPGKSCFGYAPFDALQLLQEAMGTHPRPADTCHPERSARGEPSTADESIRTRSARNDRCAHYDSFEALYAAFEGRLAAKVRELYSTRIEDDPRQTVPTPLIDMWVEGCIERGRGYRSGGPTYTVRAPHAGGLPDVANSLLALKVLVFDKHRVYDERRLSYGEMREILRDDWEGHETLRREMWDTLVLYGNDDQAADAMLMRVYESYVSLCESTPRADPRLLRPAGISTFGREIEWRGQRAATPFGRHAGDILASNLAPTPGSERKGPTAVIRSYARCDFERLPNGVPLDLKLLPEVVRGERGLQVLISLLKTFVSLGGWYIQPDVVDSELLRDAQAHPERYPNLTVRVSGWSARFTTLSREWQDMVIQRTAHRL